MRKTFDILMFVLTSFVANAQQNANDSLKNAFNLATYDSTRFNAARELYYYYQELDRDSALYYTERMVILSKENKQNLALCESLVSKGYQLTQKGFYAVALPYFLDAFKIVNDPQTVKGSWGSWLVKDATAANSRIAQLGATHYFFSNLMYRTQNYEQELFHLKEAMKGGAAIGHNPSMATVHINMGRRYLRMNKLDSALIF